MRGRGPAVRTCSVRGARDSCRTARRPWPDVPSCAVAQAMPGKGPGRPAGAVSGRLRGLRPPRVARRLYGGQRSGGSRHAVPGACHPFGCMGAPSAVPPAGLSMIAFHARVQGGPPGPPLVGRQADTLPPSDDAPEGLSARGSARKGSAPTGLSLTGRCAHDRRSCAPCVRPPGRTMVSRQAHTVVVTAPEVHHHTVVCTCVQSCWTAP